MTVTDGDTRSVNIDKFKIMHILLFNGRHNGLLFYVLYAVRNVNDPHYLLVKIAQLVRKFYD